MLSRCQLQGQLRTASGSLRDALPVKTVSRTSQRRLRAPVASSSSQCLSTSASTSQSYMKSRSSDSGSLWTEDSWDDVFQEIEPRKKVVNEKQPMSRPQSSSSPTSYPSRRPRRATTNERESKVLSGMMDMVWGSKEKASDPSSSSQPNASAEQGVDKGKVSDLFSQLLRYSRHSKKYRPSNELLDKKKEQMSACRNDQELLEWAQREVFDESRRYEEEARKAIAKAEEQGIEIEVPYLQCPSYPYMIAHLMRTFRVQYQDPHLSMFIFKHAKSLSTASYVFGCTTGAYNELIETRWTSFNDLEGVLSAIEEMRLNGVAVNETTRKLVEQIRRDMGHTLVTADENTYNDKNWSIMAKIEGLLAPEKQRRFNNRRTFHDWKTEKTDVDDVLNDWSAETLNEFSLGENETRRYKQPSRAYGRDRGGQQSYKDNEDNIFIRR